LSDAEWAFFEPFVIERGPKRGRPPADHRRVLDAIFWIARTGSPWRDLPEEAGKWSSVYRQFLRWTRSRLWDVLLEALAESRAAPDSVQMIDSTIVRAHQHAAGGKGGLVATLWAVRAVASRPKFMSERMRRDLASASS
jgi:transposase